MLDFSLLTPRQREIYDFIREKIEGRGYGPTVREIGKAFHIASPNGVMCHLKALQTKGFIKREGFSARAIELVDFKLGGSRGLPLLGAVAAGKPIEAVENPELLNVNKMFEGDDHFALQVRGDSMIEDHIEDGDYVVLRKKKHPSKGECVVARINGDVTLKRFFKEDDHIRLEPANGTMKPLIVPADEEPEIVGVLIGVIRKC
jgi:repressor LexA